MTKVRQRTRVKAILRTPAAEAEATSPSSAVLLDGPMLARLMVDHGVGVQVASAHTLKRLDQDYFEAL